MAADLEIITSTTQHIADRWYYRHLYVFPKAAEAVFLHLTAGHKRK
jgi:hypothetical protein